MSSITIGNTVFEFVMSPEQLAALGEKKALSNQTREAANQGKTENLEPLFETDTDYLQWVMGIWYNSQTPAPTSQEVTDKIQSTLNAYANIVDNNVPEVAIEQLSPEAAKAKLIAYVGEKRWNLEVGGMTFAGMSVPTDDRAKLLLMGSAGSMADEDTAPFVVSGNVVNLTGLQFKAIYAAIIARVKALFEKQADVISKINSDEITTIDQINSYDWTV